MTTSQASAVADEVDRGLPEVETHSARITSARAERHRVVIIGGGFGGLNAAQALRKAQADVILVDRRNFHLFQPLLYQVATGGLSPANIAAPLRGVLGKQSNCEVLLADVVGFDLSNRQVLLHDGRILFDSLIVAAGARHSYFGKDEWEPFAPGLKTIEDATEIRSRILTAFETAEREAHPEQRRAWLNFVIVGGGPTGVELAGALAEIATHSLKHDFRSIDPSEAHVVVIEAGERVLSGFPPELSTKAEESLHRLGVDVLRHTLVTHLNAEGVTFKTAGGEERLAAKTVLWAAGVQASPLGKALAEASGCQLDRAGRIVVEKDLSLPGYPDVFVIGDMASYMDAAGKPLPGVAPVAIQEGRFVAQLIDRRIRKKPDPEFHYHDYGSLATIGKSAAVAHFGRVKLSGFLAWVMWLLVHLMKIVSFRNRVLVLIQWGWSYFSYDRSARLITGKQPRDRD
jgi:NADH dehydrogenase